MVNLLHECETPNTISLDYISICCGAERNEYADNFCGQCNEATTFECIDCGKPETIKNIIVLESGKWQNDSHDIPEPTEQYDIDIKNKGTSDLPNPHPLNEQGQYLDSTLTWREACGCSEANDLDNNHSCGKAE